MRNLLFVLIVTCLYSPFSAQAKIIFVKSTHGGGSGGIQFEVPVAKAVVEKVMSDDKVFILFIPGMKKWKVISQESNKKVAQCTMSMSGVIPPANYIVQVDNVSKDEIKFKRISGDLKNLEGSWKLLQGSHPNSTTVIYNYSIETGLFVIPNVIIDRELRKHLIATETRVKNKFRNNKY
jgi:ribosome-associated toxin RatA of RatAB toxin-antitoxin module